MRGSALVRRRPKDLDLLITYRDGYEVDALEAQAKIRAVAKARRWPTLDIVTLRESESETDQAIQALTAVLLDSRAWPPSGRAGT